MVHRSQRRPEFLMWCSAAPMALVGWLLPQDYAGIAQAVLLAAAVVAGAALLRFGAAYLRYRRQRRRFQRVLAAEAGWRHRTMLPRQLRFRPAWIATLASARNPKPGDRFTDQPVSAATAPV